MLRADRVKRLRRRVREAGWRVLPGWGARWLYWNAQIYRLPAFWKRLWRKRPVQPPRIAPPVCLDLKAWCQGHPAKAHYEVLMASRTLSRKPPQTIEPQISEVFPIFSDAIMPEKALVRLTGAKLVGNGGLVVLPDGSFVAELTARDPKDGRGQLRVQPAYYTPLPRKIERKRGNYYSLLVIWYDNYHHWNHDVLMRMYAVIERLPSDTQFIVPATLRLYQLETLRWLGIPESKWLAFPGAGVAWELDSLYVTIPYVTKLFDTPEVVHWFRQLAFRASGVTHENPTRRIYISRRLTDHDRYVNEPEVQQCLAAHGIEPYLTEDMSVRDQVALFAEAELIVGTGAGLLNSMYAAPSARLLEIQNASHVYSGFYALAEALGRPYWYMVAPSVPNPASRFGLTDMYVPVDKLEHCLAQVLG
jgi:Glycosyltransferase 61